MRLVLVQFIHVVALSRSNEQRNLVWLRHVCGNSYQYSLAYLSREYLWYIHYILTGVLRYWVKVVNPTACPRTNTAFPRPRFIFPPDHLFITTEADSPTGQSAPRMAHSRSSTSCSSSGRLPAGRSSFRPGAMRSRASSGHVLSSPRGFCGAWGPRGRRRHGSRAGESTTPGSSCRSPLERRWRAVENWSCWRRKTRRSKTKPVMEVLAEPMLPSGAVGLNSGRSGG
jgi:hypothetical protein